MITLALLASALLAPRASAATTLVTYASRDRASVLVLALQDVGYDGARRVAVVLADGQVFLASGPELRAKGVEFTPSGASCRGCGRRMDRDPMETDAVQNSTYWSPFSGWKEEAVGVALQAAFMELAEGGKKSPSEELSPEARTLGASLRAKAAEMKAIIDIEAIGYYDPSRDARVNALREAASRLGAAADAFEESQKPAAGDIRRAVGALEFAAAVDAARAALAAEPGFSRSR